MANVPRRRKRRKNGPAAPSSGPPRPNGASNGSPAAPNGHGDGSAAAPPGAPPPPSGSGAPPPPSSPGGPRCPADELEDLLVEREEGAFLYGLENRVYCTP